MRREESREEVRGRDDPIARKDGRGRIFSFFQPDRDPERSCGHSRGFCFIFIPTALGRGCGAGLGLGGRRRLRLGGREGRLRRWNGRSDFWFEFERQDRSSENLAATPNGTYPVRRRRRRSVGESRNLVRQGVRAFKTSAYSPREAADQVARTAVMTYEVGRGSVSPDGVDDAPYPLQGRKSRIWLLAGVSAARRNVY